LKMEKRGDNLGLMTQPLVLVIIAGACGGALRGVLGITKAVVLKKDLKINWFWFFISIGVSAVVGVIAASFFGDDLRLALLAGYAGADFIEGLMKIKLKNKFGEKVDPLAEKAK